MSRIACRSFQNCIFHTSISPTCTMVLADRISMNKQAYVGFASDINAVIVVFRGTQENR
jgi:hypothetical protein